MKIEEFFDKIYELEANEDRSIDHIFRTIDNMCRESQWKEIDQILDMVVPGKISDSALIGFLTISRAAKKELENYTKLFQRAHDYFLETRGEDKTKRLLGGLE